MINGNLTVKQNLMTVNSSYGAPYNNCYSRCIKLFDNYWLVSFFGTYVTQTTIGYYTKIFNNTGIPFTPKEPADMFIFDDTAREQGASNYAIIVSLRTDKGLYFTGKNLPKDHWISLKGFMCMIQAV